MPLVERLFTQVDPILEGPAEVAKPILEYSTHPAIIILGDPGAGKTTSFQQAAVAEPEAVFISVRDFLALRADRWEGRTLYLDGLDEQRAKADDGRGAFDRLRGKLDDLGCPRFRLSCRAADWYSSEKDRLRSVSPDGNVLVLRLEPLSDEDIINIAAEVVPDPADFLVQARQRGIDALIRNPQTLGMILKVVRGGVWPTTRADLYEKACELLLQETNLEHVLGSMGRIPINELFSAAGHLCAIYLCGGTKGLGLNPQDADGDYPFVGELGGDQAVLASAARRRVFRAEGLGHVTPIHRTIAEYLAAHFLAHRLRDGLPLKRILALLTGHDGGTLSELRGIYAWLACLREDMAAALIHRDPLGIILYGDVAILSPSSRGSLIESLRDLARRNPAFRAENWSAQPFGALASQDTVPIFAEILSDSSEPPVFLGCILDAIEHGSPLAELGEALIHIVRDPTRIEGARVSALTALLHVRPNDHSAHLSLLEDIHDGRILDENLRLRGALLYALYPSAIDPLQIGRYLVQEAEHHVNVYTMFVTHYLVGRTSPPDLPVLLSGVDAERLVGSPHHFIWADFFGRLMLQILCHHGETAPAVQLYDWLGKTLDQYGHPVANRKEAEAIREWLKTHPAVVQQLFCHWLSVTPFEKPQLEAHYFWQRLCSVAPPEGFPRWLLQLAEAEVDLERAEFLFVEAVRASTNLQRPDGPTLEELSEYTIRNSRFRRLLRMELCWDIPSWRREEAQRREAHQRLEEAQRALRVRELSAQLGAIRSGPPTNTLVYLAKLYFGLFLNVDRELAPETRLLAETTPEITAIALDGFVAALRSPEIPTPTMIGEAYAESKSYGLAYVILAGMDVLASRSIPDVLALPRRTLQSAMAFHYANLMDRERVWVRSLINAQPDLSADALAAFWRPQLAQPSRNIPGLYELAHAEMMKPVAQRVSLALVRDYSGGLESNLELLLCAATCHAQPSELLVLARQVIAGPPPLNDENRTLCFAVAFLLNPGEFKDQLAQHIAGRGEQAARLLSFICPSLGINHDIEYSLSPEAIASLITITGPIFSPQDLDGGWLGIHGRGATARIVQSLINRFRTDLTREAAEILAQLHDNPGLTAWRADIVYVREEQARQRRERAFKYPSVSQVIATLNEGHPANAADLQALVSSHLHVLRAELRDGPTDGWKMMWNVDSYSRPSDPRPENDCRDRLLDHLRHRLAVVGVAAEPEGHYAEDKRADVKTIIGSLNLPVEIKRHYHQDLWTAPLEQLKKLYARDPGTAGRGIYLVLWFGIEVAIVPPPPAGIARPQTASELEEALFQVLSLPDKELIEIIVIDCEQKSIEKLRKAATDTGAGP